jgi:hypothetical protein
MTSFAGTFDRFPIFAEDEESSTHPAIKQNNRMLMPQMAKKILID